MVQRSYILQSSSLVSLLPQLSTELEFVFLVRLGERIPHYWGFLCV